MAVTTNSEVNTNYATVADVQAMVPPRRFGQGTNPSNADVELYIELVEAELNAILIEKGYEAPIVQEEAPQAFALLRRYTLQGTVAQIEVSAGNGPSIERTRAIYDKSMERLSTARTVLDAPKDDARAKPRGPGVTNVKAVKDLQEGEGREPFFKRSSLTDGGMMF